LFTPLAALFALAEPVLIILRKAGFLMRIALIGQAAFAEKVLNDLHAAGEEIVHVYAPPDNDGRPDPLKTKALELGLPLSQPGSFKGDKIFQQVQSLNADIAILAFVTLIVPERVLYAPRLKSICFHPSLLPRHRGASAINWAIIQGDSETGITWFWPDQGIDTGPILIQKRLPIGENDTLGSLYFGRLFPLGVEAMFEALAMIKAGKAPAIAQDESLATYEPPCRDEHARVDFSRHAREVHNLIRGCDPQPGAFAFFEGKRVRLYESTLEPGLSSGAVGEIVSIGAEGMRIGLEGASLLVKRARVEPSPKKVAPAELVQAGELRAGMVAGN
jgi:methionyl-tRNA formyltransferase